MLTNNHKVYIHCGAGQSRSSTLAIVYQCLYIKSKLWKNPNDVENVIKANHLGSSPNMQVVNLTLNTYKDFQMKILEGLKQKDIEFESLRRQ